MSAQNEDGLMAGARPQRFENLSTSQKAAAGQIAELILRAHNTSASGEGLDSGNEAAQRTNVILVSGGKGSGKTSLVLSLRRWSAKKSFAESEVKIGDLTRAGEDSSKINKYISNLKSYSELGRRIAWLETLSLDALPRGTNLVAAIFARISQEAARTTDQDTQRLVAGILEPVSVSDRALHALGSLRSDTVMAFEGNLNERLGQMDPESYAIAAIENEKKRQEAPKRLNQVLTRLICGAGDSDQNRGLYVIPIDDLDSSPERAAEVMRLTHSLAGPRLVFLLLGSVDILDQILFYDVKARFLKGNSGDDQLDDEGREALVAAANEISSATLRKIAPPSQRVYLESITLSHARTFRPDSKAAPSNTGLQQDLENLLAGVRVSGQLIGENLGLDAIFLAEDPFWEERGAGACSGQASPGKEERAGQESTGLQAFADSQDTRYFYDGSGVLRSPPRQLADLYKSIQKHDGSREKPEAGSRQSTDLSTQVVVTPGKEIDKGIINELFQLTFTSIVDEDGGLTPPVQRHLKACLEIDPLTGDPELEPPGVTARVEMSDLMRLRARPFKARDHVLSLHILAARTRDLELYCTSSTGDKKMNPSTRASFKALHDLIKISGKGVVTRQVPLMNVQEIARTEWNDGVNPPMQLPWFHDSWVTFFHRDLFLRIWNRGFSRIRRFSREPAELKQQDFCILLLANAAAALLSSASALLGESISEKQKIRSMFLPSNEVVKYNRANFEELKAYFVRAPANGEGWTHDVLRTGEYFRKLGGFAVDVLEELAYRRMKGLDDDRAEQLEGVLISLFLLLAPETCLPLDGVVVQTVNNSKSGATDERAGANQKKVRYGSNTNSFHPVGIFTATIRSEASAEAKEYLFSELAPSVRAARVARFGGSLPSLLALAFLRTDLAEAISGDGQNEDQYVCEIMNMVETSFPFYGGVDGADWRDLFSPSDAVIRHAIRGQLVKNSYQTSKFEAGRIRRFLEESRQSFKCVSNPSNRPPVVRKENKIDVSSTGVDGSMNQK